MSSIKKVFMKKDKKAKHSEEIEDIEERLKKGHYRSPREQKLARENVERLEKRIRRLQRGL